MTFPQRSDLRADRFQSSFLARKVRRHYFPHMSTVMWPSPVRIIPVTGFEHYLLFYTALRKRVKVLRILHAARDFPTIFA